MFLHICRQNSNQGPNACHLSICQTISSIVLQRYIGVWVLKSYCLISLRNRGTVVEVFEGTSIVSIVLDHGKAQNFELGKQRIRFVSQKQKHWFRTSINDRHAHWVKRCRVLESSSDAREKLSFDKLIDYRVVWFMMLPETEALCFACLWCRQLFFFCLFLSNVSLFGYLLQNVSLTVWKWTGLIKTLKWMGNWPVSPLL